MDKVVDWLTKEACWHQWWLPRSGFVGGLMIGVPVGMLLGFAVWLCQQS